MSRDASKLSYHRLFAKKKKKNLNGKVTKINFLLNFICKHKCKNKGFLLIDNKNIELNDVWESNLQEKEKTNLASNFIYSLNNFN